MVDCNLHCTTTQDRFVSERPILKPKVWCVSQGDFCCDDNDLIMTSYSFFVTCSDSSNTSLLTYPLSGSCSYIWVLSSYSEWSWYHWKILPLLFTSQTGADVETRRCGSVVVCWHVGSFSEGIIYHWQFGFNVAECNTEWARHYPPVMTCILSSFQAYFLGIFQIERFRQKKLAI